MAADGLTLKIEIKIKWWLVPYLRCLNFMCEALGMEPDYEKLERVINNAVSTKVVR